MSTATRLLCTLALVASAGAALASFTGSARANPLAPTFWSCTRQGQLHEIYVLRSQYSTATSWFAHVSCMLPVTPGGEVVELETSNLTFNGVFQQAAPARVIQRTTVFPECTAIGGPSPTGHLFTGLEEVGGITYAIATDTPCGASSLWIVDPATGAAMLVGPTGAHALQGLAWDNARGAFYSVSSCDAAAVSSLWRIDRATGAGTVVGPIGVEGLVSLEDTIGELYAGTDAAHGGQLYMLSLTDGSATLVTPSPLPVVIELEALAATGYGLVIPTHPRSWGALKVIYR